MKKLEYTFKNDTLFKMLFVRYPNLLKQLVSELLSIRLESIEKFVITNPEMPPEAMGSKFCRLDINMIVNSRRVNLEIQVQNEGDFPERAMFHWAKIYSSDLKKGGKYIKLPHTIIISIINFNQFDCKEFHSEFKPLETTRHELLSEKMIFHFLN
ncbi:MAG: Rpn family recombination-promoting nuclease/putative transposase [Treponema sp.]|nr:Rpn family recombination-promoting nuclease/putative transposase [Treponema sp.]MCL2251804.1 Rpn family recombination-promoting nuclease/putative transposase [Treponema sp.]